MSSQEQGAISLANNQVPMSPGPGPTHPPMCFITKKGTPFHQRLQRLTQAFLSCLLPHYHPRGFSSLGPECAPAWLVQGRLPIARNPQFSRALETDPLISEAAEGLTYCSHPHANVSFQDGTFLVRDSSRKTASNPYVLMVLYKDKVYNVQIRYVEESHVYMLGTGLRGKEVRTLVPKCTPILLLCLSAYLPGRTSV